MEGDSKFRASLPLATARRETHRGLCYLPRISLERRPCRFGGKRTYFICPCCLRRVSRLAVLPEGLRCGTCGRVTWGSRHEQPVYRLIRKANKIALGLGCGTWMEAPTQRPKHMHSTTFERLKTEHAYLVAAINRHIALRAARRGLLGAASVMLRTSDGPRLWQASAVRSVNNGSTRKILTARTWLRSATGKECRLQTPRCLRSEGFTRPLPCPFCNDQLTSHRHALICFEKRSNTTPL